MRFSTRDVADGSVQTVLVLFSFLLLSCSDGAMAPDETADVAVLEIAPRTLSLRKGAEQQLTVVAKDDVGRSLREVKVRWTTDAPKVVRIDDDGKLTALEPGNATVSAVVAGTAAGELMATANVVVKPAAVLELQPARVTMTSLQDSLRLPLTIREANGDPIPGAQASFRSTDTQVLTVTPGGSVISRAAGIALVIAAWEAAVDTAIIEVRQEVAMLAVTPPALTLSRGDSVRLDVNALDAKGNAVKGAQVKWASSNPAVAEATADGWLVGRAAGRAKITAAAGMGSAAVDVSIAPGAGTFAVSADSFVNSIGVNVHLSYFNRVYGSGYNTIIKPRLRELGVRHLRDGGNVWQDEGWMQSVYSRYRDLAQATGARFTIIMSPRGTASGPGRDYTDASHVRTLLDRIGWNNVEAFEGLNEHDFAGAGVAWLNNVRTFQRALYDAIRQDPALANRFKVLGPSLGRADKARLVGDLSAWMDYAVMHPYPGGREPTHQLAFNMETLRPMNGSRPVIATETGYHTTPAPLQDHPAISERAMGKYMPRLFLEYFRQGVVRTFAYELIDQGNDRTDMEQNFGLLRVDGSPKPAFNALRNLIALLSDPGPSFTLQALDYQLQGDTSTVRQMLFQKRDGRFYLVLWQAVPSYDVQRRIDLEPVGKPLTLRLTSAASRMTTYEPLTGSAPLAEERSTTSVSVVVRDHPLVIEIVR